MLYTRRAFILSAGVAALLAGLPASASDPSGVVRIGMLASMFRDVKPAMMGALSKPFNAIVHERTGLANELVVTSAPDDMRTQLESKKIQFGVFHSHEFAWMSAKQPDLVPLMITVPRRRPLQTYVVVHASCKATSVADLRGKVLVVPSGTREYSRLYIDRQCRAVGTPAADFFAGVSTPPEQESALHEVAENKRSCAALVDIGGLESFASRHPVRNKRLRVLATSEEFPPSVVAYHKGLVDEGTLRRFRDGMSSAHTSTFGKHLLSMWNLSSFEPVPADYSNRLAAIAKLYPPLPDETK